MPPTVRGFFIAPPPTFVPRQPHLVSSWYNPAHMPRKEFSERNPLRYQLPLEFPVYSRSEEIVRYVKPIEQPFQLRSPADVANYLMLTVYSPFEDCVQEELHTLILDTKNYVRYEVTNLLGSLNTTVVRVGELFREPIRYSGASIVIAHNHPSGDPTPSPEDVHVTELVVQAGELLGIAVLDHLVIGHNRYVSLKEKGLGFK